jgi:uncharacterized glyoxalase superfamily protein PhnB
MIEQSIPGAAPVSRGPVFVPTLGYVDAPRAIAWLTTAFGFEVQAVYPGEGDTIAHAQLRFGSGMIMLGSAKKGGPVEVSSPVQLDGRVTGGIYVILESDDDVDRHYERARAAGAEIVQELSTPDYGGRTYSARDPEGVYWSFGSYHGET